MCASLLWVMKIQVDSCVRDEVTICQLICGLLNSWNMPSEMSAVTFFGFFNFVFLIDFLDGNGVDMAHFGHANSCIFVVTWQIAILFNESFVMPGKPAWLRIHFRILIFGVLWRPLCYHRRGLFVCVSGIARSSGRNSVGLHDVSFWYSGHCCFEYM